MEYPGIVVSALGGGSGKTILSIGIIATWRNFSKKIAPFKKGPDYIDAGWLALSAGQSCYNLDSFIIDKSKLIQSYSFHSRNSDISVIEGNRGLYDGIDISGLTSTAEIAKLLNLPVILCIDCTKATRTMAAVVSGCIAFDKELTIGGVVLNRVAGSRHEKILRETIEYHCNISVLGAIPKFNTDDFPERHMGLVPTQEHSWALKAIAFSAKIVKKNVDLDKILKIASKKSDCNKKELKNKKIYNLYPCVQKNKKNRVTIGILKDSAFQFYYPDNIEALIAQGAKIVYLSPIKDDFLDVDAVYIGGGFPETHAEQLSENRLFINKFKSFVEKGLPVYAECGGLIYLGEKIVINKKSFLMAGILPIVFGFCKKPQGHGYTIIKVDEKNPYYKKETVIKGHEFRYSKVLEWRGSNKDLAFSVIRGKGFINKRDGVCYKNVLASYTHIHALGTPLWAELLIKKAILFKKLK